jgi:hypothetical protein
MSSDENGVGELDARVGVQGVARLFTLWAANKEILDPRQVLSGLGHLGEFLKAVSDSDIDIDIELGDNRGMIYCLKC